MRLVFIIAFLSFFTACSSGEPEDSKNESEDRMQTFLGEFPEKQFLSISLGQDKQTAEKLLGEAGYYKSMQPNHFVNDKSQTEVFISEGVMLTSLKIFFMNNEDVKDGMKFKSILSEHAISVDESGLFSVYNYCVKEIEFSATFFGETDQLRLNFELKSSH